MAISIHAADATAYRVLSLRTKLNKTHVVVAAHSVLIKKGFDKGDVGTECAVL